MEHEKPIPGETTSWTVSVSKDTDRTVRSFLAQRGLNTGLSEFIEEAVRWRVFDQTVAEARAQLSDLPPESLAAVIDEAVMMARRFKSSGTA